eukprot:Gb_25880 [translate_table: standard]
MIKLVMCGQMLKQAVEDLMPRLATIRDLASGMKIVSGKRQRKDVCLQWRIERGSVRQVEIIKLKSQSNLWRCLELKKIHQNWSRIGRTTNELSNEVTLRLAVQIRCMHRNVHLRLTCE